MKVSVIIPIYNVEEYLEECIDSILNQSLDNVEIICINDGSTDNSLSILNKYSERNSNIKIINQENTGAGTARNRALKFAEGEYIYFLDGDDYLDKDTLLICYEEAKKNNLDIVTFDAILFYEKSYNGNYDDNLERDELLESRVKTGLEFMEEAFSRKCFRTESTINFYRREFLEKNNIKYSELKIYEDVIQVFDSFILAERVKYIPKKFMYRRVRNSSAITTKLAKINVDGYYQVSKDVFERYCNIEKNISDDLKQYFLEQLKLYMIRALMISEHIELYDYTNEIIRYFYSEIRTINVGINTIINSKLLKYIVNINILNDCIIVLEKENLSSDELILEIRKLIKLIHGKNSYNELDSFKNLKTRITNILLQFNILSTDKNELANELKTYIMELLRDINRSNRINIYFYGIDKYNLINTCLKERCTIIKDKYEIIRVINELSENDINILIISEETVDNNIEITKHFNNIVYYDKAMNYLFDISDKIYYGNYDYNYLVKSIEKSYNKDIKTIIVGNSYPLNGIDQIKMNSSSINIALSGQDLYYSCKLAENTIKNNTNIKNCIIGAGYFLFNHDLSRSKNEDEINKIRNVYYPILNDKHNLEDIECVERLELNKVVDNNLIRYLFNLEFLDKYFKSLVYIENNSYYNKRFSREITSILHRVKLSCISSDEKYEIGKNRAEQHNKLLKYNETYKEYRDIFYKFIEFLKSKNIKIIIIVFPTTKYYSEFLDEGYKKEFYNVINNIKDKSDIELIDFSEENIFNEEDFSDVDHLNEKGAVKVTNELNRRIFNK